MGRLEELRINAYLSEVARGYRNNAFVADVLFPTIYSEKEKIDIFQFNKEAFNIYDTERAIRANSNVISPQGFKKHTTTLTEHDLSYPIDYREEQEAEKVKLQLKTRRIILPTTKEFYLEHPALTGQHPTLKVLSMMQKMPFQAKLLKTLILWS